MMPSSAKMKTGRWDNHKSKNEFLLFRTQKFVVCHVVLPNVGGCFQAKWIWINKPTNFEPMWRDVQITIVIYINKIDFEFTFIWKAI